MVFHPYRAASVGEHNVCVLLIQGNARTVKIELRYTVYADICRGVVVVVSLAKFPEYVFLRSRSHADR